MLKGQIRSPPPRWFGLGTFPRPTERGGLPLSLISFEEPLCLGIPQTILCLMDSTPFFPDRLLQWANIVYMVAVAVIAVATFAIYHLSARVTAARDRELQQHQSESELKIAAAQAEAAEAMKIAESERLVRAELESQITVAEARAAEANAVASKAQLELANLKKPRTIAPDDQQKIIAALKVYAGQKFSFSVFRDPEALALLRTLDVVLKSAGWIRLPSQIGDIVVDVAGNTAGGSHDSGVTAFVGPDNSDAEAALLTLSRVLSVAGIPCQPNRTDQLRGKTPKAIVINVGKKP